jgi:hypothetical protein
LKEHLTVFTINIVTNQSSLFGDLGAISFSSSESEEKNILIGTDESDIYQVNLETWYQ